MVMGAVLVWVYPFLGLVWSNVCGIFVGGSVAIFGTGVIKLLWELCWWACSYWWGWSDQMVMGAVLLLVWLLVGLV